MAFPLGAGSSCPPWYTITPPLSQFSARSPPSPGLCWCCYLGFISGVVVFQNPTLQKSPCSWDPCFPSSWVSSCILASSGYPRKWSQDLFGFMVNHKTQLAPGFVTLRVSLFLYSWTGELYVFLGIFFPAECLHCITSIQYMSGMVITFPRATQGILKACCPLSSLCPCSLLGYHQVLTCKTSDSALWC